ncbi:MAG: Wzz/FepE/Etk N-terminal domain-containing protein [Candidatus Hinthialibacter antarcticus]|nr:Wzz/FepE/Etk N-terminal domain-containing protein [Candidatus Hinthialibacter antarcticus]
MAETLTYDLISILRVLYRKRRMIVLGTIAAAVIAAIAALLWPQTWRAETIAIVSPPKYKETLSLVSNPFDVLTYQSIMLSDGQLDEVQRTLRWGSEAVRTLITPPELDRLKANPNIQDKALRLTPYQLIQNTNTTLLTELLIPEDDSDNPEYDIYIYSLSQLGADDLEALGGLDADELQDLTIFDLRKMLFASVSIVKETNLETIYSPVIRVSAEYDTGERARMLTNLWMLLFQYRSERTVRSIVMRQIDMFRERAVSKEKDLGTIETDWKNAQQEADLETLYADAASKWILLKGVAPVYKRVKQSKEEFDLEESDRPFMTEESQEWDSIQFNITAEYEKALLPQSQELKAEISFLKKQIERGASDELSMQLATAQDRLAALQSEIKSTSSALDKTLSQIRTYETKLRLQHIQLERARTAIEVLEPYLGEANLLEQNKDGRYSDISYNPAIKPDKRVFPKRTMMTACGLLVGLLLSCGWAFLQDIWAEVVRPESETQA